MDERTGLIGLGVVPRLRVGTVKLLMERFGSAQAVWRASTDELCVVEGVPRQAAEAIDAARREIQTRVQQTLERARQLSATIVALCDATYPERLKTIYDPPPILYVRGTLATDELAVAIVGSRHATPYGLEVAEQFASELAARGITVVSGLARGIDAASHRGALRARGRTIGVLGSGLGHIYPREHSALADDMARQGAVISEFPLDAIPNPAYFPQRNRIITGLSLGVVVVEAAAKSGALITAGCAGEQGRDILAVPGRITSTASQGTHALLRDGATLVTNVDEICEALRLEPLVPLRTAAAPSIPAEAQTLWSALSDEPTHVDVLGAATGLDSASLASLLLDLELRQLVRQWPGQLYTRSGPLANTRS